MAVQLVEFIQLIDPPVTISINPDVVAYVVDGGPNAAIVLRDGNGFTITDDYATTLVKLTQVAVLQR